MVNPTGEKPVSPYPTIRTLPANVPESVRTVLDYFCFRYNKVPRVLWQDRFARGLVQSGDGPVDGCTLYRPGLEIRYHREGRGAEPPVRAEFGVVHEDDDLLVADKPHFLPVMPSGRYVSRCLLTFLRDATGNPDLVPLHRLDRDTAGLVAFSKRKTTRRPLAMMFEPGKIRKEYRALCELRSAKPPRRQVIEGHLAVEIPYWKRRMVPGEPVNSRTEVICIRTVENLGYFRILPHTGKTHQIRVHLASIGCPILNDRIYCEGLEPDANLINAPLQLLAARLDLIHPLTGMPLTVRSRLRLAALAFF
jgi:tRNA pseudouridine32 synthase/23S rRNA pseudouridine746 synthase